MLYRPPVTRVMLSDEKTWMNVRLGTFLDVDFPAGQERFSFREEETGDIISGWRRDLAVVREDARFC
jgi:hypothetical protein